MRPPDETSTERDSDLVASLAYAEGAARAWPVLVARHSPRMYAVARSFALDAQTAEDLVQTAWLRLLDRHQQLRDGDSVGPWLCMVVRNEARRLTTRRREVPTLATIEHQPVDDSEPDETLLRDERSRAVQVAFARLSPECQQLLRLALADPPLSYDELAAALGRPRGSLGPSRRRCLDHLRTFLPAGFEP